MKQIVQAVPTGRFTGLLLLAVTSVLWSTNGVGIKWIDWHPIAIAGMRSGIAAVIIWLAFRHTPLRWTKATLCGAMAYATLMFTFVGATKLTTAANAILLQYTSPIYVAILSALLLKEKPHRHDWLTIVAVGGGIILFFQDQMTTGGLAGNILALVSGLAVAVMTVSMRMEKDGSPHGAALLGNTLAFFCALPWMLDGSPNLAGWTVLGALGIFQLGVPYVLYSIAIKQVTALEAALVTVIEPILNPLWVILLVGELPGPWSLVGGGIILTSLAARYVIPLLKRPGIG